MEPQTALVTRVANRPYWRQHDALVILDAWQRSREPLAAFARRHGIDPKRLGRWAARLQGAVPAEATPVQFHPVRLLRTAADGVGSIEIELPAGPRVRLTAGFDPDDLRRVLAVLGEHATC